MSLFELAVTRRFAAAHRLDGYDGSCSNLHGHTWAVEVKITGKQLDSCGMLLDFKILKKLVDDSIKEFDHHCLNDLECFNGPQGKINPTAENLAQLIYRRVKEALLAHGAAVSPHSVTVWESADAAASYRED